jgi:GDPmannose 4,6-dehydratase
MKKHALLTGITGQDGSYLAEQLLEKGYKVFGLARRCSTTNTSRIDHIKDKITFIDGDLSDQKSLLLAVQESMPDEVYNLAAQSFVAISWNQPEYTMDVNAMGCLRMLEAIRQAKPDAKFYQASSSEMFGQATTWPQNEQTPFHPRSPYGISKVTAYWLTVNYRESYGLFTSNGILYNHESERRGLEFVTRKISHAVAEIAKGKSNSVSLGNLDAKRDWGYSPDYCEAMWLMLQQDKPDDYVIATGETRTVREFVTAAFRAAGIDDWEKYVQIDPQFIRPAEVDLLCGDASKARNKLGWKPKTTFEEMVKKMVEYDLENQKIRGIATIASKHIH